MNIFAAVLAALESLEAALPKIKPVVDTIVQVGTAAGQYLAGQPVTQKIGNTTITVTKNAS